MSTCPSRNALDDFLNEALENARAAEISRHIEECRSCRDQCEQLTLANFDTSNQIDSSNDSAALNKLIEKLVHDPPVATDGHNNANQSVVFPIPAHPDAPLGKIQSYRVLEQIGAGSQGKLFRAFDESLRRVVAIKVLHQRLAQTEDGNVRITREARAAAALRDDNIVQVYQIGNEPDFPPFLVMEFVEGESLTDRIGRAPPIPVREAVEIVRGAALGLQAAHNSSIIHRDIKPSNILLDRQSGRVKLTDFGLALEEADANRVTAEGMIAGTPSYMSPEQITRPDSVDSRSDLYSLGVVFYELLTGEVPFRGVVRMTLLQVVHDEPLAPRRFNDRIPKDLETICLKAMSKQPAARFASAPEMIAELDRWLDGKPIRSRPVTRLERSWRWCQRNPVVAILSGAVASLLVSLAAISTYSAIRLSASERLVRDNALAAVKQRDAALDTLGKLVFELQQKFDHDTVDLDLLQEKSLRIALDGLERIRQTTLKGASPDVHTAEALRRLGEILLRLGKDEQAVECLTDSERILRSYLQREPANRQALQALVETLWLLDEADSYREDDPGSNRLNQATAVARKLIEIEPTTASFLVLANALLYEGRFEFANADHPRARKLLDESRSLYSQILSGESEDSIPAQTAWLECSDLISQVLVEQNQFEAAMTLLLESTERASIFIAKRPDDFSLLTRRLGMVDRLARLLVEMGDKRQAVVINKKLDQLADSLANAANKDTEVFFDVVNLYGELADENLADEDIARAESFQRQQLKIIEARLVRLPDDEQGRLALARCWSDLASLSILQDHSVESIEAEFGKSLEQFRTLTSNRSFDVTDWQYFLETLIEAIEFSIDNHRPGYQALIDETRGHLKQLRNKFPADEQAWLGELEIQLQSILETGPPTADRQE